MNDLKELQKPLDNKDNWEDEGVEEEFDSLNLNDDLQRMAYELNDARRTIDQLKEDIEFFKEDNEWLKEENEWLKKEYDIDVEYITYLLRLKTPLPNLIIDKVVKWFKK